MQHIDLKKLMAFSSSHRFFIFSFTIIFLSNLHTASSIKTCYADFCHFDGPVVRFPFRLSDQHERCGYPGFNLSCNGNNTIIQLPNSPGKFIVQNIDYSSQTISINDPDHCLPRRFLDSFSLLGSPFRPVGSVDFDFFSCSSDGVPTNMGFRIVQCLSKENFTVVAVPNYGYNESLGSCSAISNVSVPILWPSWSTLQDGVLLKWLEPDCLSCEERRGICGFKNHESQDLDIGCHLRASAALPRTAKYGITIGVAIPGLLCFIGLLCYTCSKVRAYYDRSRGEDFTTSITPHPQPAVLLMGLDGSTIESFPKILLGESGRLPKPNDNTCPICLSEYQPKETLRTIPECNHYFHAECIDEWLKMNATCPLCRNSPDSSDIMTPSSSTSSSLSIP